MILVTIGTSEPFERLLHALDGVADTEELVVQRGRSATAPRGARCVDFLEFDELLELARKARVVVTHAGVGSVLAVLASGKRPVVVPRLARFGEAVDDHQLAFARRLRDEGLALLVEGLDALPAALTGAPVPPPDRNGGSTLADELRAYLAATVGRVSGSEPQSPW